MSKVIKNMLSPHTGVITYAKNKGGSCDNHGGIEQGPWGQASSALPPWEAAYTNSKTTPFSVSQRWIF